MSGILVFLWHDFFLLYIIIIIMILIIITIIMIITCVHRSSERVKAFRVLLAVFILETRYPSGRASANILQIVQLSVSSIKTGTRRVTRLDELLFETCLERRISKSSSSGQVTHLVPIFILDADNRTICKMFAEARPDG